MIGCIVIACLAISVAGVFFATSRTQTSPTSTLAPTRTPIPTATLKLIPPTVTSIPTLTMTVTAAALSVGEILLEDDFDTNSVWDTGTDADSSVEYLGDALNFQIFTSNYFVWSTPNDEDYEDIHMEVTVINYGTDGNTAFGFMCNQQSDANSFHYFAITPLGQYAIARSETGQTDLFLTNSDDWEYSDLIPQNAASYRIGADCGIDGTLTLYVDGQVIDSAVDLSYTSGGVGLFAWSAVNPVKTDISFDDFLITDLP